MSKSDDEQNPLLSYLDEMVDKLRTLVPKAISDGDETAIHHARVATRRLHAAMEVLKPISGKSHRKEFSKVLSKLRKALGPARDVDVMLGHLKELDSKRLESGVAWLADQLQQAKQKSQLVNSGEIDIAKIMSRLGAWWGLRQEWLESFDQVDQLICQSLHLQLDEFIEHADAVAGRQSANQDDQLLDPHQLRIAGKALRYTLEMAVGGGHRVPARVTSTFKRMQDALGLWHDFVVLNETALESSLKHSISLHDTATQLAVLEVAKSTVVKANRELAKFRRQWNSNGQYLAKTILAAFSLSAPKVETRLITESKTDPDPSDSAPSAAPPAVPDEDAPSTL